MKKLHFDRHFYFDRAHLSFLFLLAEWRANRAPRAGKQGFKRPARTTLSLRRLITFKLNPPISYQAYLEAYAPWVEVPARHCIYAESPRNHIDALSLLSDAQPIK